MIRLFDILLSIIALIILLPILLPICIILGLTGEREIFYLQERVGKDLTKFKLYKFATMLKNSENMGAGAITVKGDPRVLPFGRFLRKSKINELPQLINILIGDMSFIGPRPQVFEVYEQYPFDIKNAIFNIRPGLSGIGSIVFRNEEKIFEGITDHNLFYNGYIVPYKCELESWYSRNYTIKNYLLMIYLTLWYIFFPSSSLVWKFFQDLPSPKGELRNKIVFS
mgnify:CR=1 FL=1